MVSSDEIPRSSNRLRDMPPYGSSVRIERMPGGRLTLNLGIRTRQRTGRIQALRPYRQKAPSARLGPRR